MVGKCRGAEGGKWRERLGTGQQNRGLVTAVGVAVMRSRYAQLFRACSQVQKGGVPTCLDLVAVAISADTRTWGQQNFFLSTRYKTAIRHSAQCAAENSHTHGKG